MTKENAAQHMTYVEDPVQVEATAGSNCIDFKKNLSTLINLLKGTDEAWQKGIVQDCWLTFITSPSADKTIFEPYRIPSFIIALLCCSTQKDLNDNFAYEKNAFLHSVEAPWSLTDHGGSAKIYIARTKSSGSNVVCDTAKIQINSHQSDSIFLARKATMRLYWNRRLQLISLHHKIIENRKCHSTYVEDPVQVEATAWSNCIDLTTNLSTLINLLKGTEAWQKGIVQDCWLTFIGSPSADKINSDEPYLIPSFVIAWLCCSIQQDLNTNFPRNEIWFLNSVRAPLSLSMNGSSLMIIKRSKKSGSNVVCDTAKIQINSHQSDSIFLARKATMRLYW